MKKGYYLFLLLLSACAGYLPAAAQQVIALHQGQGSLADVVPSAGTLLDETGLVAADDMASGACNDKFTYPTTKAINYGITRATSWCIFRVTNTGTDRVFLSVHNPIADSVVLYRVTNGKATQIGMSGLFMPVSSRQMRTENHMFDLGIGADTGLYILRVKSLRNHAYSLQVGYLTDHIDSINRTTLWNAIFLGFALLMALYHMFLFISIRNIPYLYYVGYVLSFGLFNAYINGSAFLYLWPEHYTWNHFDNLLSSSVGIFSTLFTIYSLDLPKYSPRFARLGIAMTWLYVANVLFSLAGFPFEAFLALQIIVPIGLVLTISAAILTLRRGSRTAIFFLVAWSVTVSGICVFLANNFNVIEYSFFTEHVLQMASLLEGLILAFALADRFNNYKKEKEALMRTQNEMLELRVAERTDELRKQQNETEQLLLNILPEEVAAELKEKGVARSRNYGSVTVLFTDFKDFTRIVENITPEQLINDLNYCFSAFDNIIEKYDIEKIKTIGDSYMCAGGFGTDGPASARDVVQAGIEIRDFMERRNREEQARGGNVFEVRIGIHTGPVIAGIIGIKKFAYDIWGDTVNIASRMESAGETGKVNISGITYDQVKDHFECTYRGRMPAKNKGEVDMYFAEGLGQ